MENEQNPELEQENTETELEEGEEITKPELTPEQILGIKKRKFTKLAKELGVELEKPKTAEPKQETKKGFDYGEKAFLRASDVRPEEFDSVWEATQASGKSIEEVLDSKWFQSELKERRESMASKEAIPTGSKRSTSSPRDTVEYWIAKGVLPPKEQFELRKQVVNAKIKKEQSRSVFTDRDVA